MNISLITYNGSLEHVKHLNFQFSEWWKVQNVVLNLNFFKNMKMLLTQKIKCLLILKDTCFRPWTRIRQFLFLVTSFWRPWLDSVVLPLLIHFENCQGAMRWIPRPPELISAYCVCLCTMQPASLSCLCYLITFHLSLARKYHFISEMYACFPTPNNTGIILLASGELEECFFK